MESLALVIWIIGWPLCFNIWMVIDKYCLEAKKDTWWQEEIKAGFCAIVWIGISIYLITK